MTGDGTLFAGATIKHLLDPANIFFSVNCGGTWSCTDPGLAQAHFWKYDVNAYASVADVRFVGTGTGLVRSINGGTTWEGPDTNLRGNPIYSFISANGKIIAGSTAKPVPDRIASGGIPGHWREDAMFSECRVVERTLRESSGSIVEGTLMLSTPPGSRTTCFRSRNSKSTIDTIL